MSSHIEIASNVWDFIHKASEAVGRMEAERFGQEMQSEIIERFAVSSPIEQIFLVALHTVALAHYDKINPEPLELNGAHFRGTGIHVQGQHPIDQYRVDFLIERVWFFDGRSRSDAVIVELDGHDFHDKDKRQRSYEKARDRHLARKGFKVLHYTGSDLVRDPWCVAHEVMDTIECFGPVGSLPYEAGDPFAQGY